jgi:hypothetical protein
MYFGMQNIAFLPNAIYGGILNGSSTSFCCQMCSIQPRCSVFAVTRNVTSLVYSQLYILTSAFNFACLLYERLQLSSSLLLSIAEVDIGYASNANTSVTNSSLIPTLKCDIRMNTVIFNASLPGDKIFLYYARHGRIFLIYPTQFMLVISTVARIIVANCVQPSHYVESSSLQGVQLHMFLTN